MYFLRKERGCDSGRLRAADCFLIAEAACDLLGNGVPERFAHVGVTAVNPGAAACRGGDEEPFGRERGVRMQAASAAGGLPTAGFRPVLC